MKVPIEHEWVPANKVVRWPHCTTCGVIKRHDGQNGPCRGRVRVTLRDQPETAIHVAKAKK